MDYWKTVAVDRSDQNERESKLKKIEDSKGPYLCAMEDDWEGVTNYYKGKPGELLIPMTVGRDTAFHLAASCCSKSQAKRILEMLINILTTSYDKRRTVRKLNNTGNNTLHDYLVSNFNEPVGLEGEVIISNDKENDALPLLETRNDLGETPLFRAAVLGHTDLVKFYARKLEEDNPDNLWRHFHRKDKMSILHMAVIGQRFETALWLLENYYDYLAHQKEDKGLTCLQLLAQMPTAFQPQFQQSIWKMLIYYCLPDGGDVVTPNQKDDVEINLDSNQTLCQSLSRNKLAGFAKVYSSLWDSLAKRSSQDGIIYRIWKDKKNQKSLKKIIHKLVKSDYSCLNTYEKAIPKTISLGYNLSKKRKATAKASKSDKGKGGDGGEKGPEAAETSKSDKGKGDDGGERGLEAANTSKSDKGKGDDGGEKGPEAATTISDNAPRYKVYNFTPLLIATITGIMPIVEEILEQHPQAVEHVNYDERNILHLAIRNRRKEILDLIKSKPTVMLRLKEWIDCDGNTILHQAADRGYYTKALSQKLIGPAMQLQEELRWTLCVKEILPPRYILHRNKKDQTAEELFNYQHEGLLGSAQEWVKETAQSCSTVAVLVATVVFAAAYAIPGGTSDQNGLSLFQDDPLFLFFACMDIVGIACSLSSVAFFLSVLSSPLEYPYFVKSLPRKIMTGFILLFLSMAATMLAFAATILLLIRVEKKWTKSILYPIAFFPVPLFGLLQFPMYQSFIVMFRKIDDWIFSPLRCLLGFSKRRSIWGKRKAY
ncbi:ankyrin repeat-containing protein [Pyrus ussuriensis x Pyrus communis]|uniref:Ankyrin repeat-containing protein n=1 Tax=Pyrus ussuriensis x Pyrus communis TaxID=2448454 RepID=A0A5N5FI09_9ROSA|nr:ankyrin repeat-containing protein [Pyrus ussuriensis x Pyrus communis]